MSAYNPSATPASGKTGKAVAKDATTELADTAKHDLESLGDEVKEQAVALGEEAKAQLGEVTEKAMSLAAEQKDLLARQLSSITDALQKVAGELDMNAQPAAGTVRALADGARKLSATVQDNDVDSMMSIVQDFGRKQPIAFLGAAALLGFAASRFVVASASRPLNTDTAGTMNYGQPSGSSTSYSSSTGSTPDYAKSVGGSDAGI